MSEEAALKGAENAIKKNFSGDARKYTAKWRIAKKQVSSANQQPSIEQKALEMGALMKLALEIESRDRNSDTTEEIRQRWLKLKEQHESRILRKSSRT